MKTLILAFTFAAVCLAQSAVKDVDIDNLHRFKSVCTVTTAATTAKCALVVPSTANKNTYLESVVVTTPAAVSITFGRGGTAPSATAQTTVARNTATTSVATVYQDATTAGAATSSVSYTNPASTDTLWDLSGEVFPKNTANTLLVTAGSSTGTVQMVFFWAQEK
jgi:hypothetical protein